MNYQDTLNYLYTRLPYFSRDGAKAIKKDLTNTRLLCSALGNPELRFPSIHVAGTNGKGSTSHMLAAVLQEAGYRTGLYTSPHLVDFSERIRVQGEPVSKVYVTEFVQQNKALIERIQPSFFEVSVAMAFDYFARASVDIAVIETGLGGRLDSTNVIRPQLSLITNIGRDHADILGETLEAIAREKSGIIKAGVPVVISEFQPEVAHVFEETARERGAVLHQAGTFLRSVSLDRNMETQQIEVIEERIGQRDLYTVDLLGTYQRKNLLGVLTAIRVLRAEGWKIPEDGLLCGLARVQQLTGLQGRWQTLAKDPLIICDTGHNQDGWRVVLENIQMTPHRHLHLVLGVMKDKDLSTMLPVLPMEASYYFCQADTDRALPSTEFRDAAAKCGLRGDAFRSVSEAVHQARSEASSEDLVFVGGSNFIVGEVLAKFST